MIDYSKWVGKKVYVSIHSYEDAQQHKKEQKERQCMTLDDYCDDSIGKFFANGYWWEYAVLAEEEEEEMEDLKFGDLVECRDEDGAPWYGDKIYFGKKGDLFLAMTCRDYEILGEHMNHGKYVWPYRQCRKVPTKEYTMEELEKIVGHKFKIKP